MRIALLSDIHGNSDRARRRPRRHRAPRRGGAPLAARGPRRDWATTRSASLERDHHAARASSSIRGNTDRLRRHAVIARRRRSTTRPRAVRSSFPVIAEVAGVVRLDRGVRRRRRLDPLVGRAPRRGAHDAAGRHPARSASTRRPDRDDGPGINTVRHATTSSTRGWPAVTRTSCSRATRTGRSTARPRSYRRGEPRQREQSAATRPAGVVRDRRGGPRRDTRSSTCGSSTTTTPSSRRSMPQLHPGRHVADRPSARRGETSTRRSRH